LDWIGFDEEIGVSEGGMNQRPNGTARINDRTARINKRRESTTRCQSNAANRTLLIERCQSNAASRTLPVERC